MTRFGLRPLRNKLETRYLKKCGYGSGREFMTQLVASVGPGDVLVDAGCGEGKLRQKLSPQVRYIGLDRYVGKQGNEYANWHMRPTILGDVQELPFAPDSCKTVALMHVLEHVSEPAKVFAEIFRVLEPGGYLFADVPFLHEIHHAPHDYFRYTSFSLTSLAKATGLQVVEIRPSGGYFRTLSHLLEAAPAEFRGEAVGCLLVRLAVAYPLKGLGWIFQKLQYLLDSQDDSQNFTCGYHCIYRKPSP